MSLSALLIAVRNKLRVHLEDYVPDNMIHVMPDGRPSPNCGQRFVAVYGSSWSPRSEDADMNIGVAEEYGVVCTLSVRSPVVPQDDIGDELYVHQSQGMETICRKIREAIHQQYDVVNDANTMTIENHGILEYLRWKGTDASPRPVGPEWFYALDSPGVDSWEYAQSGLAMDVRFGDAFQINYLPDGEP